MKTRQELYAEAYDLIHLAPGSLRFAMIMRMAAEMRPDMRPESGVAIQPEYQRGIDMGSPDGDQSVRQFVMRVRLTEGYTVDRAVIDVDAARDELLRRITEWLHADKDAEVGQ